MANVLIVDDEPAIRKVLSLFLTDHGNNVTSVATGREAIEICRNRPFDIVLLDLSLPDMGGLDVQAAIRASDHAPTTILMTAFGTIRSAVDAMRGGAFDYLTKPFDNDQLLLVVERALGVRQLRAEVQELRRELHGRHAFNGIIGISAPMREAFRVISRVSKTDQTVLILGESGTGKELVARAIHRESVRSDGPFVAVNCSAIPSTLIESEFFGVERGAYTDARESRPGKFEQAEGGTLFLDEIGDLPLDAQAKLLRALQDKEVTRLGGRKPIAVNVRLVAATHRDLRTSVALGQFRSDLYYRLDVLSLSLPPLRERGEDLPLLIEHLFERLNLEFGGRLTSISPEARRLLLAYDWPGNVRELENAVQRGIVLAESTCLRAIDLPVTVRGETSERPNREPVLSLADGVARAVERVERALIQAALAEHGGNRARTAESLDINRKTLFNKMKQYALTAEEQDE